MKVGLCGLGDRLGYLAEVFRRAIPDFEVVAYADPAPAGVRRMDADHFRRLRGYPDLERMLDAESLDLVMVGSPNVFHCDQLCTVLDAGIRTFCEKPVVVSEKQTFRLLSKLMKHGSDRVMVGLVLRYAPLYADLTRLVDEGRARQHCQHRGIGTHPAGPRRVLLPRLAAQVRLEWRVHAGEVLSRHRPLRGSRAVTSSAGGQLRRLLVLHGRASGSGMASASITSGRRTGEAPTVHSPGTPTSSITRWPSSNTRMAPGFVSTPTYTRRMHSDGSA